MFPSFTIFGKEIGTYMLCSVVGALFAGLIVHMLARDRDDVRKDQLLHIAIAAGGGLFVGAHLLFGLTNMPKIIWIFKHFSVFTYSFDTAIYFLQDIFGGMVFYGGLFGGIIGGLLYIRSLKLDKWAHIDLFAPAIPAMHAFGRIGCFLSGCCYGIESDFGFVYHHSAVPAADGVRRFPVQLLECIVNLCIVLIMVILIKRGLGRKKPVFVYGVMYSVARFLLEFLRGDKIRGIYFGLSTSQWISIVFFTVSVIALVKLNAKGDKSGKEAEKNNAELSVGATV